MNQSKGHLFVISAPTGGGKTTIVQAVIKNLIKKFPVSKVITYTTRPPRPNEQNGIDYHFISESEFLAKQQHGDFLETTQYDGYWYGSPKSILPEMEHGKSFILVTDRAGVRAIKTLVPDAVCIWITVPSIEVLEQRLRNREAQSNVDISQRLAIAAQEMEEETREPLFTYYIMNNDLEEAIDSLTKLISTKIGPIQ